jgi:cytochrome-b5 reductase
MNATYPERFKLFYTVDVEPKIEWNQGVGFMTQDMLKRNLPEPDEDTIILYCGPPIFESMMQTHLSGLGYTENMIFKF